MLETLGPSGNPIAQMLADIERRRQAMGMGGPMAGTPGQPAPAAAPPMQPQAAAPQPGPQPGPPPVQMAQAGGDPFGAEAGPVPGSDEHYLEQARQVIQSLGAQAAQMPGAALFDQLGMSDQVDDASLAEYDAMTPEERMQIIGEVMQNPFFQLQDALVPEGYEPFDAGDQGNAAPMPDLRMADASGSVSPEIVQMLAQMQGGGDPSRSGIVQALMGGDGKDRGRKQSTLRPLSTEEGRAVGTPGSNSGTAIVTDEDPSNPAGIRQVFIPSELLDQQRARQQGLRDNSSRVLFTAADNALQAFDAGGGGMVGMATRYLPFTDSAELYRQVETMRSMARINNLQAMREASPTGGALGQVSDAEGRMLEAASGSLDPASPHFERDMLNYVRSVLGVVHGMEEGDRLFFSEYGDRTKAPRTLVEPPIRSMARGSEPSEFDPSPQDDTAMGEPPAQVEQAAVPGPRRLRFNPATGQLEPVQ